MPVQIGAKAHSFADPTGLLSDCHRRIEMFLGSLKHVAGVVDRPLTAEARVALESALRYFRESAPKHTADEEESLFPRLRRLEHPEVEKTLTALDALESDHRKAEALQAKVDALGIKCLDQQSLPAAEAEQFRQAVEDLAKTYAEHIQVEDEVVFPAAKRRLSGPEQSAIANEMASRPNLHPS
jgi:hemerythrin-like domain-containing protein